MSKIVSVHGSNDYKLIIDFEDEKPEYLPLRLSVDSILFSLRD